MTELEKEKIQILNLLVWLQVSVFSADECSTIKWFNRNQTKMLLNRLVDTIDKEHGVVIKELWNVEGVNMDDAMREVVKFSELVSRVPYYRIPDLTQIIQQYIDTEGKD
jgi:hypothetical protein